MAREANPKAAAVGGEGGQVHPRTAAQGARDGKCEAPEGAGEQGEAGAARGNEGGRVTSNEEKGTGQSSQGREQELLRRIEKN